MQSRRGAVTDGRRGRNKQHMELHVHCDLLRQSHPTTLLPASVLKNAHSTLPWAVPSNHPMPSNSRCVFVEREEERLPEGSSGMKTVYCKREDESISHQRDGLLTRADDTVESFSLGHVAHEFIVRHVKHDAWYDTVDEEYGEEGEDKEYEQITA